VVTAIGMGSTPLLGNVEAIAGQCNATQQQAATEIGTSHGVVRIRDGYFIAGDEFGILMTILQNYHHLGTRAVNSILPEIAGSDCIATPKDIENYWGEEIANSPDQPVDPSIRGYIAGEAIKKKFQTIPSYLTELYEKGKKVFKETDPIDISPKYRNIGK